MITIDVDVDAVLQALIDEGTWEYVGSWASGKLTWEARSDTETVVTFEDIDGVSHVVDVACLRRGLTVAIARLISGEMSPRSANAIGLFSGGLAACDANGIDCLVQCGLFGKPLYS